MRITLNRVSNARKDGKWFKIDIEYTREGGKPSKRTLVAVGDTKKVIEAFREDGAEGCDFEVKIEKDGEFYNWVGVEKMDKSAAPAATAYKGKSTYETPEERARKNVSIARQNALTNAVNYFSAKDGKATVDQILSVATEFAAFTLGELDETGFMEAAPPAKKAKEKVRDREAGEDDIEDDIPF